MTLNTPEDIRKRMDVTMKDFAAMLGMPLRTYEDKTRKGFKTVDLLAAKWVYLKWSDGSELY